MTTRVRASPCGTCPDSNGISRNGSGFLLDQNIGIVIIGPVIITSMIAQITINNHGLKANMSPCESPGRTGLSDREKIEYKLCDFAAFAFAL